MGDWEESQSNTSSMQRVKVYRLNEDGTWDDRGTGPVTFDYIERSEELGIYVIDEDVNDTLLVHCISGDDIYRKQDDIVISWRDLRRSTEMALSFQDTVGCFNVWDQICSIQRNLFFNSLISKTRDLNSELRELPAATMANIPQIHEIFTESGIKDQMKLTKLILEDHDFFRNLMELFKLFEDLELANLSNLISEIVKAIFSFKNRQILEKIIRDELIMETIRCLGYDPCVPYSQHCQNRLKEHVIIKEALPIKDPMVLNKIYQAHYIRHLKDFFSSKKNEENARGVDETLDSIICANNASIVSLLKDDSTFIQELFARLRSPSASVESKKNLVYILHELCSLSKSLEMMQQLQFFRDLINEGIFDIIVEVLRSPDKEVVLTGASILIPFMTLDPKLLRSYVVKSEGSPLLGLLIKGMIQDFGEKMHCQFQQIIQNLLDSNALCGKAQSAKVLDIFCEKHLPELVEVISASCQERPSNTSEGGSKGVGSDCGTQPQILLNICELLRFCIQQDSSRAKDIFLNKNVSENVLLLTRRKEKYLKVAAIQFFRSILSVHDDDVQSYVVMTNMLKPIVDAFVANGNQYNLLNSTVLELLEHIRKENATVLIKYVVETFWDRLTPLECLPSLQVFKVKYEQSLKTMGPKSTADAVEPRRVDESDSDNTEENSVKETRNEDGPGPGPACNGEKEEESGGNREKEEEESKGHDDSNRVAAAASSSAASWSPRVGRLVDYDDDESSE